MTLMTDRLSWLGLTVIILASVLGVSGCLGGMPETHTSTPTEVRYETCPAFDPVEKEGVPVMHPPSLGTGDDVTLHPNLVEDTIEAIKRELKDPYTIERLEIEEAGEALAVTVTDIGPGDRLTGPRYELEDGRELYKNIHLWGYAAFEDGSEISFHVWAHPVPSGQQCEIQGVAIQPSSFLVI